jgi:transposase
LVNYGKRARSDFRRALTTDASRGSGPNELVNTVAPGLQDTPGVGPVTAAIIYCAYSHQGRIRSESAFANLAGVAPQPASSGNTVRHRLNRGGDRQLNRAFDIIVRTRLSYDPDTRTYAERRRTQGKSAREIRRNLIG